MSKTYNIILPEAKKLQYIVPATQYIVSQEQYIVSQEQYIAILKSQKML